MSERNPFTTVLRDGACGSGPSRMEIALPICSPALCAFFLL